MSRSGAELALLLLGGFRTLAAQATTELAARGFEDVRPLHDFALRAIIAGADSASDLGRATSVTKQAAAKTIAVLEERGYVTREPDPADRRRLRVRVTDRGLTMLREGEQIFDELRAQWEEQVGAASLASVVETLRTLVGEHVPRTDSPAWDVSDLEG
ncbi:MULTISPECIES: MarR family winged helix-turn-helix transcriptional regulator [Microbacterium]|uniref:MarR family transcriptional regulator n=1 Tax=Microbacterium wangchenii TaxID=2541726 RepID=A0ABX5SSY1_9MICO|nr:MULTISPECIES: MarR family transcriptional regulator [Microbacterium]MCK6065461.1 winged helix DNA-binding protein [Microbacterium sp. EYE_512]QBR88892.1 MarR family transcriptional regulator [Microbacterium wangchenii]